MVFAEKVTRTERDPDSNIEKIVDLGFVGEPKRSTARARHGARRRD
jgi:acetylglutamate kinase